LYSKLQKLKHESVIQTQLIIVLLALILVFKIDMIYDNVE